MEITLQLGEGLEGWLKQCIELHGHDREYWVWALIGHGKQGVEDELAGRPTEISLITTPLHH